MTLVGRGRSPSVEVCSYLRLGRERMCEQTSKDV
jgi:hypothetical protein